MFRIPWLLHHDRQLQLNLSSRRGVGSWEVGRRAAPLCVGVYVDEFGESGEGSAGPRRFLSQCATLARWQWARLAGEEQHTGPQLSPKNAAGGMMEDGGF